MKEKIKGNIKETTLSAEEWFENMNVQGVFSLIPVYINRPPVSCEVIKDYKRNEYRVYSIVNKGQNNKRII